MCATGWYIVETLLCHCFKTTGRNGYCRTLRATNWRVDPGDLPTDKEHESVVEWGRINEWWEMSFFFLVLSSGCREGRIPKHWKWLEWPYCQCTILALIWHSHFCDVISPESSPKMSDDWFRFNCVYTWRDIILTKSQNKNKKKPLLENYGVHLIWLKHKSSEEKENPKVIKTPGRH